MLVSQNISQCIDVSPCYNSLLDWSNLENHVYQSRVLLLTHLFQVLKQLLFKEFRVNDPLFQTFTSSQLFDLLLITVFKYALGNIVLHQVHRAETDRIVPVNYFVLLSN